MEKEIVKQAYEESLEDLKKKQIGQVKKIITKTLEKIDELQKNRDELKEQGKELEEKIKILRADIEDLKEGRLDRIEERQKKDPQAKDTSVVIIIKEKEIQTIPHPYPDPYPVPFPVKPFKPYNPWYEPYIVCWQTNPTWTSTGNNITASGDTTSINNSVAKFAAIGTYEVAGGIINLR